MIDFIFPITNNWSWLTFILYVLTSLFVCWACKKGALLNAELQKRNFNFYYVFSFIVLVLLASLRSDAVGPDTAIYVNLFLNVQNIFSFDYSQMIQFREQEPGFSLLLLFVRTFTENYTVLFFIVYSIVAFAYVSYVKFFYNEKSEYLFLFVFIFFYVSNMSGMRSALGQAFLLFSFIYVAKKNYLLSIAFTLVAASFHYTMLYNIYIVLFVCLFLNSSLFKRRSFLIVSAVLLISFAYTNVYALNKLFANTKYSYYSVTDTANLSFLGSAFFVLFGFVSLFYMKRLISRSDNVKILFYISWAFLLTYPMLLVTSAYRIPNYYAMVRLSIWSECFQQYQIDQGPRAGDVNAFSKVVVFFLLLSFLLLRFTKSSLDGFFVYYLK